MFIFRQITFNVVIFVSLFTRYNAETEDFDEDDTKSSFRATLSDIVFTEETVVQALDENLNDAELKNRFIKKYKPELFKRTSKVPNSVDLRGVLDDRNRKISDHMKSQIRVAKAAPSDNSTEIKSGKEFQCYECDSLNKEKCYGGEINNKTCSLATKCFIELNPMYIKRGCMFADRINRTFFCKCPLCNNKPATDDSYFNYNSLEEWRFDNRRLDLELYESHNICKHCHTEGTQSVSDAQCIQGHGSGVTDIPCAENEVCFTNVDDEMAHISRGCIKRPVYNSIFFFCDYSMCNNKEFDDPSRKNLSDEEVLLQRLVKQRPKKLHLKVEKKSAKTSTGLKNYRGIQSLISIIMNFILLVLFNL